MKIHFVTFASSNMKLALDRIIRQANQSDFFDVITSYTEKDIPYDFFIKVIDSLHSKSQKNSVRWYLWKVYFINLYMERMAYGDILVFLDAGCHINPKGKEKFFDYLTRLEAGNGIMAVMIDENHPEYAWTKADVFAHFGVMNDTNYTHTPQICAGHVFLQKNVLSMSFVKEWVSCVFENIHIYDDTPSHTCNFPGFKGHRWEQSIFSILCKKYHACILPLSDFEAEDWNALHLTPFHDRRDRGSKIRFRYLVYRLLRTVALGRLKKKCKDKIKWFETHYGFYLQK